MSVLQDFLERAFPGLALYVVLVTFGVVAFRVFSALRSEEQSFRDSLLPRIREVYAAGVRQGVEPLVEAELRTAVLAAITKATRDAVLRSQQVLEVADIPEASRSSIAGQLEAAQADLTGQAAEGVGAFLASYSGSTFTERLEAGYSRQHRVLEQYGRLKSLDLMGQWLLAFLGVTFFLGLLGLASRAVPMWAVVGYLYLVLVLGIGVVISLVGRERCRRHLNTVYEDFLIKTGAGVVGAGKVT
jgi:hypothetical protein